MFMLRSFVFVFYSRVVCFGMGCFSLMVSSIRVIVFRVCERVIICSGELWWFVSLVRKLFIL